MIAPHDRTRIVTGPFALLCLVATLFFSGIGVTLPLIPGHVREELGGGDVEVGVALSALALAAIAIRPVVGRIGDRFGRRVLLAVAGASGALGTLGYVVADSLPALLAMRVLVGIGQGTAMVGATTMAVDMAPAARRGEAASFVLVAVHLGIGGAPALGELLAERDLDLAWCVAAGFAALAGVAARWLPGSVPSAEPELDAAVTDVVPAGGRGLLHPAGLRPGVVVGLGILGYNAFLAFLPLIAGASGVDQAAPIFGLASGTMIVTRVVGRALPDRLGARAGGTIALAFLGSGLGIVGAVGSPAGLVAGTVVAAVGSALLFPSLMTAAVDRVAPHERTRALGTFTMFMDMSLVAAGVVFGPMAAATSYGGACLFGGATSLLTILVLRGSIRPRAERTDLAAVGL